MSSIDSLLQRGNARPALVTYALAVAMLIVSVPTFFFPQLHLIFGGVGLLQHPWQVFSSAFQHGWPGVPLLPHLVANLFLIGIVGVAAEKLLGSARFLLLTLFAVLCYWLARLITGIHGNGSSVFIWSYAPVVFMAIHYTAGLGLAKGPAYERCKGAVIIMWAVVTAAMGILMSIRGVNPVYALPLGNVFHISGTAAGFLGVWLWRDRIRHRLLADERPAPASDSIAATASFAVPLFFAVLLVLWTVGEL